MRLRTTFTALSIVLLASPAFADETARILHSPVNQTRTGKGALRFRVLHPEATAAIVVRYRALGGGAVGQVVAERGVGGWVVEVPEEAVRPPGFSYWAVERLSDGNERPIFASEQDAHPVHVFDAAVDARMHDRLDGIGWKRSQMTLHGEYVDFGRRHIEGYAEDLTFDRYYRMQAIYSYSILGVVDRIEIGGGHFRGEAAPLDPAELPEDGSPEVGMDYGQAAITWFALPVLRFRTSLLFGFSQEGFETGAGAQMMIGRPWITNFTLGMEGVTRLGYSGHIRLGWATVPHVPMGASVVVTNFPAGEDSGVRLLYDLGYEFSRAFVIRATAGYQGRTSVTGGPSVALEIAARF